MEKYWGLPMVLFSWAAGAYLVRKWRGSRAMSISQHAASANGAAKLFAGTLIFSGFIFYLWLITWFSNELQLTLLFKAILTISFACQVIAAIVPDTKEWKKIVHRAAAYLMSVLYIPLTYMILKSTSFSIATSIVCVIAITYMIFAWSLFFFVKKSLNHYLILQSIYIVIFQCAILFAAYVR